MKVSILFLGLCINCFGRAYLLSKIFQKHYEIEITGPIFGEGIREFVAKLEDVKYINQRRT